VPSADAATHEGNVGLKVKCIEALDIWVVKPLMQFNKE